MNKNEFSRQYPNLFAQGYNYRTALRAAKAMGNGKESEQTVDAMDVKLFWPGTQIQVSDSTYNNEPVFILKHLLDKAWFIHGEKSQSQDTSHFHLGVDKQAWEVAVLFNLSGNFGLKVPCEAGIVSAGFSFESEFGLDYKHDVNKITANISYTRTGVFSEINTGPELSPHNFTPYILGSLKDQYEHDIVIADYVSSKKAEYSFTKDGKKQTVSYPSKVKLNKMPIEEIDLDSDHIHTGLYGFSSGNYFVNVYLIGQMQQIFYNLKEAYLIIKDGDPQATTLLESLYKTLSQVKKAIEHAVQDTKSIIGTHFVSKLYYASDAQGIGELNETYIDVSTEMGLGSTLSVGVGVPDVVGVQGGLSSSLSLKGGYSGVFKDMNIDAHSHPADLIDTNAWVSNLKESLSSESGKITVPSPNLPDSHIPDPAKIPDIPETKKKKKELMPPDCVFSSYDDWKKWQKDRQKDQKADAEKQHDDQKKKAEKAREEKDYDIFDILFGDGDSSENVAGTCDRLKKELSALRNEIDNMPHTQKNDSPETYNHYYISNMYGKDYETTEYSKVIPELRTSQLTLPSRPQMSDSGNNEKTKPENTFHYANKLLLSSNHLRHVVEYIRFMSKFTVSNINFYESVFAFYSKFIKEANIHVKAAVSSGIDMSKAAYKDFLNQAFGPNHKQKDYSHSWLTNPQEGTALKKDQISYIFYLLQSNALPLWRNAPGGYASFVFGLHNKTDLYAAWIQKINSYSLEQSKAHSYRTFIQFNNDMEAYVDVGTKVSEMPDDLLSLYDIKDVHQSPFFPIFRYEAAKTPKMIFLQLIGPYQIIYGKNGTIQPFSIVPEDESIYVALMRTMKYEPKRVTTITDDILDNVIGKLQGFDINKANNENALIFPHTTQGPEEREKARVLIMEMDQLDPHHDPRKFTSVVGGGKIQKIDDTFSGYLLRDVESIQDSGNGTVQRVDDGSPVQIKKLRFPLLLPITYDNVRSGVGSLPINSNFGLEQIQDSPSFQVATTQSGPA